MKKQLPTNQSPLVSIITVNYNTPNDVCDLLVSIQENDYDNIEVIVVDNASTDTDTSIISNRFPEVKMILSPINLGFAGGNNLGIKAASGDYLFFVNSDIVIPKGTIQILLSTFAEYKNIGIISPKFYVYNQPNMLDYAGCSKINFITGRGRIRGFETIDKGLYDIPSETHYCHGGGMMIHNSLIEKVGLIPDPYFLYYEEMEWCEKIHRAGYKVFYQPKATLLHKVSTSIGSSSTTKTYYMTRNRILFMRRNRPTYIWVIFFLYFIIISIPKNVIYFLVKAQFKHLKYFLWAIIWNIGYKLEPKF